MDPNSSIVKSFISQIKSRSKLVDLINKVTDKLTSRSTLKLSSIKHNVSVFA